ncbi:MAG: RNA polymerase sigma factor, partial [Gammaproteobacteria bacterium]|nr:RNA polymerase sigma factor [Gammaproteobacteria bacterium]
MSEKQELKSWFSQQVDANMDSLYFLARRLTGCKTRAEDLVAESISKAWSNINKLQDHSRFRPWLFCILNNHFISDYRKQSGRPTETSYDEISTDNISQDEISCLLIQQSNEFLHWWGNPEMEFYNQILAEDIMNAIESLPEVFRITVLLVNVEGFSYDEAA